MNLTRLNINSVLHLYVGCECIYDSFTNNQRSILTLEMINNYFHCPKQELHKINRIVPILRTIDQLDTLERAEYESYKFDQLVSPVHSIITRVDSPKSILYLLNSHIDIFNLIENKLAIKQ